MALAPALIVMWMLMTHLDLRNPLVFDTRTLGRRAGAMIHDTRSVPAPDDFGTDVIAIPAGAPLDLDVRLESVLEGVLASGSVRGTATGACVRCLDDVTWKVDVTFQDLFAYADRAAHLHEVGDDDEDQLVLEGDLIDLEPVLRDAVVPTLPFQPVCREDCRGLCSECGERLDDDPDHHHESIDPRWAALQGVIPLSPAETDQQKRN